METKPERELIYSITKKDLVVQTYKGSGPGGQNRNKNDTAVRIRHPDSGAVGECQEFKSQRQNKKAALERLVKHPKFRVWHSAKIFEHRHKKSLEQMVDEMMHPKNIKVEIHDEQRRWVVVPDEYFDTEDSCAEL